MSGAKYPNPRSIDGNGKVTVIDATGLVLGRMATAAAKRALDGETVHIVNAEKAIIAGSSKRAIQDRYRFKREVGTLRKGPFFPREPHLIVRRTVRGMIPYQKASGRAAYKRVKAHIGVPRDLASSQRVTVEDARREPRNFLTIAELATYLGRATRPEPEPAPMAATNAPTDEEE